MYFEYQFSIKSGNAEKAMTKNIPSMSFLTDARDF